MSVAEAFAAIADKNSDDLWLTCKWNRDHLELIATGKGNFDEFRAQLAENQVVFGVYKVYGMDHQENVTSKRDKLVAITWVGSSVSPLARNAVLSSKTERVKTFSGVTVEVQASDLDFCTVEDIGRALLACGGAHKPTVYQFGDFELPLSSLSN